MNVIPETRVSGKHETCTSDMCRVRSDSHEAPVLAGRLTTACSDPSHDTVHAPDYTASFSISAYEPYVLRPVADAGR